MNLSSLADSRGRIVWLFCLAGVAMVILMSATTAPDVSVLLMKADPDDQMRLLQVRNLLAGQSWWDTHQYRVLPPDGISMHWSRYIDAALAVIVLAANSVLSMPQSELAAAVVWPSLLACLMVLVHVHGTARLLGAVSSVGALAVFFGWSKLGGEFVIPRVDHHGVQILCGTILFYLTIVPGRPLVLGALGGVVTGFGLAIGLEMLPFYATIWGLMSLRHAFRHPGTGQWLLGFGAALTVAAPLFFAGQTPISEWGTPWCDVLAAPVMALGLVGVIATLTPVLGERFLTTPVARLLALAATAGLGLWLAAPVLGQCLAGPYSGVSPEILDAIESKIVEALSARELFERFPWLLGRVLLPPVLIIVLSTATWWKLRGHLSRAQMIALMQAFVVAGVGLVFALHQIRAANLMSPAIPFLAAFLVHGFAKIPRKSWLRVPAMIILVLALPTLVEEAVIRVTTNPAIFAAANQTTRTPLERMNCRTEAAIAELDRIPPSRIFSTMNYGPTILFRTSHTVTSAGYHRSFDALWNALVAFTSEPAFSTAIARSKADYLVLCSGSGLERDAPWIQALVDGNLPDWLQDVTVDRSELRVLKVDKDRLADRLP